jgi:hypothetical protein
MRSLVGGLAAALALAGCKSDPQVSIGMMGTDGNLKLYVFNVAPMAKLEVCGIEQKDRSNAQVPVDCLLPANLSLDRTVELDSKPIPIVVKHVVGGPKSFHRTVKLDVGKQRDLLDGVFHNVTRGATLTKSSPPRAQPGVAFTGYGGVRAIDASTLGEVDIVVRVNPVNRRETGRTCSYTGAMRGQLRAYDAELEAFDAHTGKSIAKTHLANDEPVCPSTNYGHIGENNSVSSYPPEREMNAWARSLKP